MRSEMLISSASAAVAFGAAAMAAWAARGTSVKDSFDLARSLYAELTSPTAAAARSALEFYRRAPARTDTETRDVLDHYFALLWAFEHVHAGRESLTGQKRINGTGPAVDYLDKMTAWHVSEWARRWSGLRHLIHEHTPDLDDHHSISSFCDLADAVLGPADTIRTLRQEIDEEARRRTAAP
ncbi:hypothetical protein AB0I22_33100 [Streptomyces sp. NPDC050610]|uniref:hypothetical protein n=1 Tax=Streptomyces sp. NPDC050610 TaxID=3157097 RepID=UPI003416EEF9